jgi:acyl-CoA hydrolase
VLCAVAEDPAVWAGQVVTGAVIPGINERILAGLEVETIFVTGGLARAGVRHLPLHYSAYWQLLSAPGHVGCVVWAVPPPRGDGTIGLGIAADFAGTATAAGAGVIGAVHPDLPDVADGPRYPVERLAALVEGRGPVPAHDPGPADAATRAIAARVVALLRPGDTLQPGLGRLQGAVLQALPECGLKGLHFHAGMNTPGVLRALGAGAGLRPDFNLYAPHRPC